MRHESPKLNACYCSAKRKNGFAGGVPWWALVFHPEFNIISTVGGTKRRKARAGDAAAAAGASRLSLHNIVLPLAASGYTVNIFRRLPDWKILSHSTPTSSDNRLCSLFGIVTLIWVLPIERPLALCLPRTWSWCNNFHGLLSVNAYVIWDVLFYHSVLVSYRILFL